MYLLLKKPSNNSQKPYRGTDRAFPYYVEGVGDDHPANKAFFWFIDEGGEFGIVHNLQKARSLVDEYRNLSPLQEFEIVKVSTDDESEIQDAIFLGYDVSHSHSYSVLEYFFQSNQASPKNIIHDKAYMALLPLLDLMQSYFEQFTNENGLFSEIEKADFFLHCMNACTAFYPNIWEHPDTKFEVVKLWRIET